MFEKIITIFTLDFIYDIPFFDQRKRSKIFPLQLLNKNKNLFIRSLLEFIQLMFISIYLALERKYNLVNVIIILIMIYNFIQIKES